MNTFLITGGAGFIGGNYLLEMVERYPEDRFVCLDALTYAGNKETLASIMDRKNFRFVYGDIRDRDRVYRLFEEEHFDYVINFAAESHVDRSIVDPSIFLSTNILGTGVLMDACCKYGIKRYHQVSTDEVYGDLPLDRPDLCFHEDSMLHGSSPYAASKASADLLVLSYHRTFGLPVTISRCSNNYGPYQFPEKLIPFVIDKALQNEPIYLYGDGRNVRDWIYVGDHNNAIDRIVRYGRDGEIYNIGGHNERSNLEVVKVILKALGKPESLITFIKDRPGHDLCYRLDTTKIEAELGWRSTYDFETGIVSTLQWYLSNQEWLRQVESGESRKRMERYSS